MKYLIRQIIKGNAVTILELFIVTLIVADGGIIIFGIVAGILGI